MPETLDRPGAGARLACLFYEALTVVAVVIVFEIIPYTILGAAVHLAPSGKVLLAHLFLILLLYFAWQWTRGGQTLAMKTWRIRLVTADGEPLSPNIALLRYTLAWIGILPFGLTFLWALLDRDGLYLHDRLSGTRLITVPRN
jgi:uncharacterized RDD family membrane protein YckC